MVRFAQASSPAEIAAVAAPPWGSPRVLFLQHPSDPVVWWSSDLLFRAAGLARGATGFDRSRAMRWYPIVTFWQVGADLTVSAGSSESSPFGHGHNYGRSQLDGWVAVAAPEGWTPADTERIRRELSRLIADHGPEFRELRTPARTTVTSVPISPRADTKCPRNARRVGALVSARAEDDGPGGDGRGCAATNRVRGPPRTRAPLRRL